MRQRFLVSIGLLMMATLVVILMSVPVAGQAPSPKSATPAKGTSGAKACTPPKPPWGDPDLQGIYTSDDYIRVGLQTNPQFGERLFLTEQEIAQRETQIATQAKTDSVETVGANARAGTGPPGHWGERARKPPKQTSLI